MKTISQLLGASSDEKTSSSIMAHYEEESLNSEHQAFLPGSRRQLAYHKRTFLDTTRSILVLLLLAGGVFVVAITAFKQAFPDLAPQCASHSVSSTSENMLNPPSEILVAPCGSTPQEAQERGCSFDNIPFAWVHPRCYDEDLSKSFRDLKFQFSLSGNESDRISQNEAYKGTYSTLHVNWEYHVTHCTWMWMKMHRAILGKGRSVLDGVAKDYQHTSHCETMLLRRQEVPYDAMNTIVSIKYPDCGA